jgi:ABC-type nitrate/sulfonate/bicarbonate transport system substrate-binding protein
MRSWRRIAVLVAALAFCIACSLRDQPAEQAALQKVVINYPSRSGSNWPLFLAKDGGYYEKYGLDVDLVFGVHPAGIAMLASGEGQMVNSSLEQLMQAASRDGSMVLTGSSLNKGTFALMSAKDIASVGGLKGKRIAVGQIGDAPYGYVLALLGKAGVTARDIQWIPVGTGVSGRAAALTSGRADATLLTAPAYFRLEETGYNTLANMAEHDDIFASTTYIFPKALLTSDRSLVKKLIQAHAEAIQRFYADKEFAVTTFLKYVDDEQRPDVERVYDLYAQPNAFERVPYVLAGAVQAVIGQQPDERAAAAMKAYDWRQVIDNSVVNELVREGFFERIFGPEIQAEQARKAELAFH